jgi:phage tail sheath protein FI
MPVLTTYPGVYIEEIPSGVHTITGVATSITAFLGKALRGTTDEPVTITSFAGFERSFGGLHRDFTLGYAVRDFFLNGGSQAIIVRLYKATQGKASKATFDITNLKLEAASEGAWGMQVRARVDKKSNPANDPNLVAVAARLGVQPADLFDLTIRDGGTKIIETFLNLTTKESARRADRVLKAESDLARVAASVSLPSATTPSADSGALTDDDVWTNNNKSTPAKGGATNEAVDSAALDPATYQGSQSGKTGLYQLEKADLFNLLCILPDARGGDTPDAVYQEALAYCVARRAMLVVDPKNAWTLSTVAGGVGAMNLTGDAARNGAIYFPRIKESDPNLEGQIDTFPPSGMIAGVMARTDAQRGVWKAPAGIDASLNGVAGLQLEMTDGDNGLLNPLGINCLRSFPVFGRIIWGARTLRGADAAADEYKYVPVRRFALFLEESLFRGTKWVVFEPNDEPLWSQIRLNVGAFMQDLFRQGAFQGDTPQKAYFVKCDSETTTQSDIDHGIVNILVGFAPLKPAEFVIIKIQQMAGQLAT